MDVIFFASPSAFRAWFEENHEHAKELWVGFYKRSTGKPSIIWPEAVDQALCFGWIDGVRKSIDENSYKIRFTPRKPGSIWSSVNVKRVGELSEMGLMLPAGLKVFEERDKKKSELYSYERQRALLDEGFEQRFRANTKAWEFFQSQAPSYQKTASWWVMSAKREETRFKRLMTLIEDSEKGRRLANMTYTAKK
jgi:uncharacterized protein YdeI (YjbR/CyaY-like superfamily)